MKNLLIVLFVIGINAFSTEKYVDFAKIADQYFKECVESNPDLAINLGLPDSLGYNIIEDKLGDVSPEVYKIFYDLVKRYNKLLNDIDEKNIADKDKIFFNVMKWNMKEILNFEKFLNHGYVFTSMFNFHHSTVSMFTENYRIENKKDVENYIKRLSLIENRFNQTHEWLNKSDEIGVYPPDFILDIVEKQFVDFIDKKEPESNIYYSTLDEKMKSIELPEQDRKKYLDEAKIIIITSLYPAYEKMIGRIRDTKKLTDHRAGVWKLPDGDEYYKACLKANTTTDLTPEEIHQIGLSEVKRIQDEMIALFSQLGIKGESFSEYFYKYVDIPRVTYPNTEEGKQQALDDYMKIIDDVKNKLPNYFSLLPRADIIVKRVPDYLLGSGAGAYYTSPSFDGKTPGIFSIDLTYPPEKHGMSSLTYHEAIPGHHLQRALQYEIDYLKYYRSTYDFNGFIEGWALYAERLAYEEDWNKDIDTKLFSLYSELSRAMRLVVDTGINYKRWSLEEAGKKMEEMVIGVDMFELYRYCVNPGQACSYKIGQMKLLELRERMKAELKDKFDIKEFHRLVLENGQIPLGILENKINNYIAEKSGQVK